MTPFLPQDKLRQILIEAGVDDWAGPIDVVMAQIDSLALETALGKLPLLRWPTNAPTLRADNIELNKEEL